MSLQENRGDFQSPWSSQSGLTDLDGAMVEFETLGGMSERLEPQARARSNTWPQPRPDNYIEPSVDGDSKKNSNQNLGPGAPPLPTAIKKTSSRRNAWGNLSYADLITQAITSAQDNRLTLSQIYEWMVQNVPYFKDKGDSNSSAGWKNSIRHNLSLHNRFMRVQNEGTGKSSWWMINPEAKPGKSVRRRAASMETSKFEKRRGRAKKKVEALRNGVTADATPSPSSSISEGHDMFPDSPMHSSNFQLSPDFRQRASSNASSCGRLSPIPSMIQAETDWATDYTPSGDFSSADYSSANDFTSPNDFTQADFIQAEQLAGSLADSMNLQGADPFLNKYVPTTSSSVSSYRYSSYISCSRNCHGACGCAMCSMRSHSDHPPYSQQQALDHFVRPLPPLARPADDVMITEHSPAYTLSARGSPMGNTMMLQSDLAEPTTVMGQIMGALNTGYTEDLNIESLDHGLDCNVDEVIKHELSLDGSLDFNFPQQQGALISESEPQFTPPAAPPPVPTTTRSGSKNPKTKYSVAPSWVH